MNKRKDIYKWVGETELGYKIATEKYFGENETVDQFCERVSGGNKHISKMIKNKNVVFGGRIMANRGLDNGMSFSNCATQAYIKDSIAAIGDTQTELMKMYQAGQGVGLCLSDIRPKGAKAGRGNNATAGVVPFAKIFNNATEHTMAGSTGRRGALLQTISIEHPDALEFISIKKMNEGYSGELLSTNISMYVTDKFMKVYTDYLNGDKDKTGGVYRKDFIVESTGEVVSHYVDTVLLMDSIIDTPEKAFDPAIVFENRFKDYHFFGGSDKTNKMSQNGCNEMIGIDGATCLLGTMVVSSYVIKPFTSEVQFDFVKFNEDVFEVIQEMDTILDEGVDKNPLEKQRLVAREWRNLGLGITALADCLIALGLKYGSKEAVAFTELLTKNMQDSCIYSSIDMGIKRGQSDTILAMEKEMEEKGLIYVKGLRNAALMAHAPSGTGSTMLGLSTGIEPIFRTSYVRSVTVDGQRDTTEEFTVYHKQVENCIDAGGDEDICVDSRHVNPLDKVKMLAAIQKHTDMCSSNTTNLKKGTTCQEIKDMYIEAWKLGVTSMSIYVDGSLTGVLNDIDSVSDSDIKCLLSRGVMAGVADDTIYIPRKINHGCGKMKIMVGFSKEESRVTDVYIIPKMGSGCSKNITGEAVLISQILRLGGNLEDIKAAINGIDTCVSCAVATIKGKKVDGRNCPNILIDTILNVEKEYVKLEIDSFVESAPIETGGCTSGS